MLGAIFAQAADPASAEQLTRDSAILGEQFYFFTVVLMWLIHAGFMSYEAGVARRKNVMATAMKNILTIAVVTPTFYYFGWMIYNCAQPGMADLAGQQRLHRRGVRHRHPVERRLRAEPHEQHQPDLLPGVPAVQLDDRLDHVRRDHRARPALGLPRARGVPRLGRVDPRRGLGLERRRLADAALRLPRLDRLGRRPRRRGRVHARGAVPPRPAHRQVHEGRARAAVPTAQPAHHGARPDADLHRLLRVLRRVPGDRLDVVPGLGEHLPQPGHARLDHDGDHHGLRRRLHRRLLRQQAATRSGRSPAASPA